MAEFTPFLERFRTTVRYWWTYLILGIIYVAMGVVVFLHPGESYLALSVVFGILILITGILEIAAASSARKVAGRGWIIASGIIEIILGLILTFNIAMSAVILPFFLGFWLLFRGLTVTGLSSDMRDAGVKGMGWIIVLAILLMLSAFLILIFPAIGVGAIVLWLAISFLVGGVAMILFALRLMGLKKEFKVK